MRHFAAAIALSLTPACGLFEPRVHVYVDNGGPADLQVSVDDAPAVLVPARGYAVLKLRTGSRRFVVRRDGQVVHDGSRDFPASDTETKYVFNPDMTRRYTAESLSYQGYESGPRFDPGVGHALRATALLKGDPWVAGAFDEVFDEKPPDSVQVKRGTVRATRRRICRITAEDHDLLTIAQARYLDALRSKPDRSPSLSAEVQAALERVTSACPKGP